MITRLLVANRGEIARRVFATCRRLGIETVAVHSDADADLPFVREADHVVHLPGTAPADTYLRADLILEAARRAGADAIHPGYGFLSENAEFARAVSAAGLLWVGPAPDSIERMGSKVESKKLMEAAGVPVLGNLGPESATEADLPLLVKASAGGGGRGMRIVRTLADLPGEIEKAAAEAVSAFGDGTVFVEPYVEHGRHVEVQVIGHREGVLVLGERDCSIQRRHQKVVEETPAPGLAEETRHALHRAAHAAAAAIDYVGAGTVEFLLDARDTSRFWFLEMNTRLQVEHPVTELVHGVDLVEAQLAVAESGRLPLDAVGQTYGHSIEVRLYAEDPAADWQPQSGTLTRVEIPGVAAQFDLLNRSGLRLDSGFESGSEVSTHYDAMLAKLVSWAPTRALAARQLGGALARARIHGLVTNRDLLVRVLRSPEFLDGDVSTDFFDRTDVLGGVSTGSSGEALRLAGTAAAIALAEQERATRTVQRAIPVAWRNVVSQPQVTEFVASTRSSEAEGSGTVSVEWFGGRDGYLVDGVGEISTGPIDGGWAVRLTVGGLRTTYDVSVTAAGVDVDSPHGHVHLTRVPRFTDPADAVATGSLLAPMPGTVVAVAVEVGAEVAAGQPVLVLEAMKMQHTVSAPYAGVVTEIGVTPGTQVAAGEVLAVVSTSSTTDDDGSPADHENDEKTDNEEQA
jgi:propionyl-CoA carboxylase alpha chain